MITYYRDPAVRVTSDAIHVDGAAYRLDELAKVWHRRGERSLRTVAGRGALALTVVVPLVIAAIGLAVAFAWDTSPVNRLAVVVGAGLAAFLAGPLADQILELMDRSYARGAHVLEIWAAWRGQPVLLLRTRDALRFGTIYRAVQRAVEAPRAIGYRPSR